MNKLLTTITLLCFSVAANADIYFCESNVYTLINFASSTAGDEEATFIVNTERGLRWESSQNYFGECVIIPVSGDIDCKGYQRDSDGNIEYRLFIDTQTNWFTAVDHELEDTTIVTWSGVCTKA